MGHPQRGPSSYATAVTAESRSAVQTCVVLNSRLALTPELVDSIGLHEGGRAQLTPSGDQLFVKPARDGTPVRDFRLRLRNDLMASLGWVNGDVVGVETEGRKLTVARVEDPMDSAFTTVGEDGAPVPPHWLVQTVIGKPRRDRFLATGHSLAQFFADLIETHLSDVACPTVMDFGCGCGRVARALPNYLACEMFGCDITASAVEWCQQNLRGSYLMSPENPPLPLDDACFDALYAVSVLTHLDEAHQNAWLAEWRRLVRPGGVLLVTYRGEGFLASRESPNREQIEHMWEECGFVFPETDHWRGVFPKYYGGAYHTHAYVSEQWGRFFDIIEQRPATQTPLPQDLAVMRRPSEGPHTMRADPADCCDGPSGELQ
jgi:SAM-dependent methyltransferase